MFTLQRVYAYTVSPQKHAAEDERALPAGGAVRIDAPLRKIIAEAVQKIDGSALTTVDFESNADRSHPVRDDAMAAAFGQTQAPRAATERLAARLSDTMDNRSRTALLLLIVEADQAASRVSMLLLPREDGVLTLRKQRPDADVILNVLGEAFSTGSGLRKLVRMQGHNSRTQFLAAEVLDLQLMSAYKSVADFWIRQFLQARPRMDTETGSRELAVALQRAFAAAPQDERDAVLASMLRAGSGAVRRTSLARFAEELPDDVRPQFLHGIEEEVARAVFDIDRAVVKKDLARHIFTTSDGVMISAPSELIGKTVSVTKDGAKRIVKYSGPIESERVGRGRRGTAK